MTSEMHLVTIARKEAVIERRESSVLRIEPNLLSNVTVRRSREN